ETVRHLGNDLECFPPRFLCEQFALIASIAHLGELRRVPFPCFFFPNEIRQLRRLEDRQRKRVRLCAINQRLQSCMDSCLLKQQFPPFPPVAFCPHVPERIQLFHVGL